MPLNRLRLVLALAAAVSLAALGAAFAAPSPGSAAPDEGSGRANLRTPCGFSHRAADDPIVFPGRPGAAHSHDFFGSTSTDAHSTEATLRASTTTCRRPEDRAAYWTPTLLRDGQPLTPIAANLYLRATGSDPRRVRPHPAGLRVIAGNARATTSQALAVAAWHCGADADQRPSSEVPTCPTGHPLELRLGFPDCWDGRNLDSPDHQGHMAYAARGVCPASHPVAVPRLVMNVRYRTAGGPGVTLSSGPPRTAHGDFLNTWDQRALERLVAGCLRKGRDVTASPCRAGPPLRIRLTAIPSAVPAGRRTAVRLRATTGPRGDRRPVRGAAVRLAGAAGRTDARGRVRLAVRLPTGRATARAGAPHLVAGIARVRAVRR